MSDLTPVSQPGVVSRILGMFSRRTGSDDTLSPRLEERLSRIEAERNRRLPQRGHVRS